MPGRASCRQERQISEQILAAGALKCQKCLDADKQDRLYAETWWAGYVTAINRTTDDTWGVAGKKSVADISDMLEKQR